MDPHDVFVKFIERTGYAPAPDTALIFFVGFAYGVTGARENIDALVEAFNKSQKQAGRGE